MAVLQENTSEIGPIGLRALSFLGYFLTDQDHFGRLYALKQAITPLSVQ